MTGSHERMKEIEADPALFDAWKRVNYAFACHEFGKENIIRFTLHRDNKTPHFHCVFVSITLQGIFATIHYRLREPSSGLIKIIIRPSEVFQNSSQAESMSPPKRSIPRIN